jgi:centrosomal protein CEP89
LAEVHTTSKRGEPSSADSLLLDRELLENLVWRLNAELGRYESRFRHAQHDDEGNGDASDGARSAPAWHRANPATLGPLLNAYDDAITEKELVIEKHELRLRELGADFQKVVYENERLHEALEDIQNKVYISLLIKHF